MHDHRMQPLELRYGRCHSLSTAYFLVLDKPTLRELTGPGGDHACTFRALSMTAAAVQELAGCVVENSHRP